MMIHDELDKMIDEYLQFVELSVKLGFMVMNSDGSHEWTEKGNKLSGLTSADIERLGGAKYLANL